MSTLIGTLAVAYILIAAITLCVGLIGYIVCVDSHPEDPDRIATLRVIKYSPVWPILIHGPLLRLAKELRETK